MSLTRDDLRVMTGSGYMEGPAMVTDEQLAEMGLATLEDHLLRDGEVRWGVYRTAKDPGGSPGYWIPASMLETDDE